MKAIAQIPLIGLIGTFTIIVGIIAPPAIIKTAIDKELLITYGFEKEQHGLLILFYSSQADKSAYELLGEKALFENYTCTIDTECPNDYTCDTVIKKCSGQSTKPLKDRLDNVLGEDKYCITTEVTAQLPTGEAVAPPLVPPSDQILKRVCASNTIQFNVAIVLPYNKESLTKIIRIGI